MSGYRSRSQDAFFPWNNLFKIRCVYSSEFWLWTRQTAINWAAQHHFPSLSFHMRSVPSCQWIVSVTNYTISQTNYLCTVVQPRKSYYSLAKITYKFNTAVHQTNNPDSRRLKKNGKTYGIQRGKILTNRFQKGFKKYFDTYELSTPLYLYLCKAATPWAPMYPILPSKCPNLSRNRQPEEATKQPSVIDPSSKFSHESTDSFKNWCP